MRDADWFRENVHKGDVWQFRYGDSAEWKLYEVTKVGVLCVLCNGTSVAGVRLKDVTAWASMEYSFTYPYQNFCTNANLWHIHEKVSQETVRSQVQVKVLKRHNNVAQQ